MLSSSQGLTTLFRKSPKDVLQQKQHRKPRKQPRWGPSNRTPAQGMQRAAGRRRFRGEDARKEGTQQKRGSD